MKDAVPRGALPGYRRDHGAAQVVAGEQPDRLDQMRAFAPDLGQQLLQIQRPKDAHVIFLPEACQPLGIGRPVEGSADGVVGVRDLALHLIPGAGEQAGAILP